MKKVALNMLAILPISYVVDLFSGWNWHNTYKQFLLNYWDVILVVILCYELFKWNKRYLYDVCNDLRQDQFFSELNRYVNTPYVPPVLAMYLKNPPGSVYPSDYAYVNDTFYRTIVNVFRDRVYVFQAVSSFQPTPRTSYLDVFGMKRIFQFLFYLVAPFIWVLFVHWELKLSMINDWPILTWTLILVSFQRCIYLIQAYVRYLPSKLDRELIAADCVRPITWRDAFPDREVGETFVRSYYFELERRQRYDLTLKGYPVRNISLEWNNGKFAAFPYPSNQLPEWHNDYEDYYEEARVAIEVPPTPSNAKKRRKKSNVVAFPKK